MVPRPDVVSVPADASLSELKSTVLEAGHTRYPVLDADDGDQVVGFVDVKDVLRADADGGDDKSVGDIARDIVITPETMALSDLLRQFREDHQQMVAVIDEWGAFEGIATVEDVVEALVGDLRDEFDVDEREPSIRRRDGDGYDIDGGVPLSKINDVIEREFSSDEVETIGGLVLEQLNRAPERGDSIEVDGHVVEVTSVDGTRISTVRVHERETDDSSDSV
jgi:CBS domain containing-hemolysin-like protein